MNFSKAWGWGSLPPHHYGCVLGTHNQCWFCHFNFKSLPDVFSEELQLLEMSDLLVFKSTKLLPSSAQMYHESLTCLHQAGRKAKPFLSSDPKSFIKVHIFLEQWGWEQVMHRTYETWWGSLWQDMEGIDPCHEIQGEGSRGWNKLDVPLLQFTRDANHSWKRTGCSQSHWEKGLSPLNRVCASA